MMSIRETAGAVRAGRETAVSIVSRALSVIDSTSDLNAVTAIHAKRARDQAAAIDGRIADGFDPGVLAGVPFAVKNLFDVEGCITRAGSRATENDTPARHDAFAIRALEDAGAVLVASTNMDELAYGFTGENASDGDTHNPRSRNFSAGGSSSGSAALVAAGAVPFALGTDTNGSIRVPAALSGTAGLKPTYGMVSRSGVYPFVQSLDHVGLLGQSSRDLAMVLDVLKSIDAHDPVQVPAPVKRTVPGTLRIARLAGYFATHLHPDVAEAVNAAAGALDTETTVEMTLAEKARAAAFVLTNAEAGQRHLGGLIRCPDDFGPLVRNRLRAGVLLPSAWTGWAQRLRRLVANELADLHRQADILIAPATPCPAFPLGTETWNSAGESLPIRLAIGMYTQPLTVTGVPIGVAVKTGLRTGLPVGVQVIGRPFEDSLVLATMKQLELSGFTVAPLSQDTAHG